MTDIKFAKAHMGEYFQLDGHEVQVIGYDATGFSDSVIVDYSDGWAFYFADSTDVIMVLSRTGRCAYVKWEDLK